MLPDAWRERLRHFRERRAAQDRERCIEAPQGLDFCSNDYLGLRRDPRLAQAARQAIEIYGSGTGASRLLRGTTPLHDALEKELARWKGTEACLLFNTGFQANLSVIPALVSDGDAIFSDALNHASLVDGCRMAKLHGASVHVYRHLDLEDLESRLKTWRDTAKTSALALVVTDSVFSMDGDTADLRELLALCERFDAMLMIDDAHATGLLSSGLAEHQGVKGHVHLTMGTLGKALGSSGAYVCGDEALRNQLLNTARGFIFSTALPASSVAAALEGLRVAQVEPERAQMALRFASKIRTELKQADQSSAILPVILGDDARAVKMAKTIQARGFDVRAVRPPAVPEGQARLRITTGVHQKESDVDALIQILREVLHELA
jgi:8-amino-7-oxononanoate synthase